LQSAAGWVQGSLGRPHVVGKGLNICGQGGVWQVMVMACQGTGEVAQGASGASILSRWVVGGVEGVGAGVRAAGK